ncbi:substrate-binding domain-containing protein [Streptomyces microflavus]|uniref:substrate-binding domain-containing protein n=1 Tax=Streptomyces microflavus TaxID=1919 RepID=UPI00365E562E
MSLHLDGLRDSLGSTEAEPAQRGTVQIGGAAEIMTLRVLPALAPLTGRGLYLHATFGLARDLLVDLAADRLDLVVSAIRPTHHALLAVPLADEEFLLVGPPSMARTVDADRLRTALAALPLVAYGEELPILRRYWRGEFGHRPANPVALVAPDLRAVLAAVETGAGISALPRYLVEPALAAGRGIQLHCSEAPPLNTIYLAVRRGAPANPALTVVRERLTDAAADGENSERGAPPCRPADGTYTAEKARGFSGTSTVPADEQGGDSTQGRWRKTLCRCGNQMMLTP